MMGCWITGAGYARIWLDSMEGNRLVATPLVLAMDCDWNYAQFGAYTHDDSAWLL